MALNNTYPSVQAFTLGAVSPIPSQKMNDFIQGTANSVADLVSKLNQVIDIINTSPDLTDASVSIIENGLDGGNLYMDIGADTTDTFYDSTAPDGDGGSGRPVTIKEAFEALSTTVSNATNQMREGTSVGSYASQVTITNGNYVEYAWPYSDRMFDDFLFYESGGSVTRATDLDIEILTATNVVRITNNTGSDVDTWGAILHPVFLF